MAEHLLKFLKGEIKYLNDPKHILIKEFKEDYPNQNGGLYDSQIIDWVKLMSPDLNYNYILLKSSIMKINTNINGSRLISIQYQHLYTVYVNNGIMEDYNTAGWQQTTNNCTLYAGIILIIRPLVKDMEEMFSLLKTIWDKKNTESADKLAQISKYYFGRDKSWFHYGNNNDI